MALRGINVLEIAGLAPVPFCGMILADFGANVIRVDRPNVFATVDTLGRGKKSVAINFKNPKGIEAMKKLTQQCDVLIEPFRPGVMEKLGLGPNELMKTNPGLIYARISGYGQKDGPKKYTAGHDINYLASSGVLSHFKRSGQKPLAPLNLLADMAGGGLACAFGITAALLERERSGKGQIIDTSMTQGSAYVGSFIFTQKDRIFSSPPGQNLLDSGCPFYDCYETKDNKYLSIGALEPQFFNILLQGLNIDASKYPNQVDLSCWDEMREEFKNIISQNTRDELTKKFKDVDGCVSPVLTSTEAPLEQHNQSTNSFFKSKDGNWYPMPAPVLSRTPAIPDDGEQPDISSDTREVFKQFGFSHNEIQNLEKCGAIQDKNHMSKL